MRIDGLVAYGISTFQDDLQAGNNYLLAQGIKVPGGTSTQYVMADGSLSEGLGGSVPVYEGTTPGLVPTGQDGTTKYLREDGTWFVPPNTQRAIHDTPVNGATVISISSNWAYDHAASSTAHPRDTRNQIAGTYNSTIGTNTDLNTSGATVIDEILLNQGVITSLTTRQLTKADLGISDEDNYVNTASFNDTNGVLTLGRTGGLGNVTVDLDGRYALTSDLPGVFAGSSAGLVPSASAGDATLFLRGDGTWAEAQGGSGGDGNNYPTSLSFNTSNGILTLGRSGLSDLTVDLDNRYALQSHTHNYDNYAGWLIYVDNVYKAVVGPSNRVTFNAGTNMSIDYSSTNKTLTFNASAATDKFLDGATFNTGNGVLSLSRNGGLADITVDLDGRYLENNQNITISGDVEGSGTTSISVTANASLITGKPALTSGLASTDELLISDAGTLKRMDVSVLQSYMQSNLSFGSEDNYVDSVSFNTTNGILTLGRTGVLGDLTVDLDDRYALISDIGSVAYLNVIQTWTAAQTYNTQVNFNQSTFWGDNDAAYFGASNDLLIRHNTGGSYGEIINYTNNLDIYNTASSGVINIKTDNSSGVVKEGIQIGGATPDVNLFYNGLERLRTTNAGVTIYGSITASTIIKSGGTNQQILLADGTTANRTDVGSTPGTSTSTSHVTNSGSISTFRVSRYGDVVTLSVKGSGTTTGTVGAAIVTILDASFIPSETIYWVVATNKSSGESSVTNLYLGTDGVVRIGSSSDALQNSWSWQITYIKRDD